MYGRKAAPETVDVVTKDKVKNDQAIVADQTLSVVLIVVKMIDFDVVLGMDWLVATHAIIECRKKKKKKKKWYSHHRWDLALNLKAQMPGLPQR